MRASIIIASHNEGAALGKTIESCIETCVDLDFELVVADDASTDGSAEDVSRRFSQVRLYRHEQRQGASPTKALGARNARGNVLVFLDGHTKPEYGAVARLVQDVEALAGTAVITPTIVALDVQRWKTDFTQAGHGYSLDLQTFDPRWQALDEMQSAGEGRTRFYVSPALIGCGFAVGRELYDKLWGFDVQMHYWGVEDLDFGLKCWLMGHRILHDPQAVIGHHFRATFDNYSVPVEHLLVNQLRMARKNFTHTVWADWLERCRQRHLGPLAEHPEGLWAHVWQLFESERASAEQERSYLHARRVRDEFWYAERFGLAWPRLQAEAGAVPSLALPFALPSVSPSRGPSPSPPPPPVLEIVDTKTGTVVSGTTQTRIVGQKIQLQVRVKSGGGLSNIQWTIPGQRIKNYTQSASAGTRTNLSAADLQSANINFYWIAGGNQLIQVSATVKGVRVSASVRYNVLAPSGLSMTSTTGTVAVSNPGFPRAGLEIHFGSTTVPGITWTFTATAPAGGGGQIAGTQLINVLRTQTTNGGVLQRFSSGGAFVLDNTVPYVPGVPISASSAATWTSSDSPGTPLTPAFNQSTANDAFRMYFMYKPTGADSIWVTIGRLDWHWAGQTIRTGPPAANAWQPPTGVSNSTNPSGSASTELPVWTANFTGITWV